MVHASIDVGPLGCGSPCDFLPAPESLGHFLTVARGGKSLSSWSKALRNGTSRGEAALGVTWRFEPSHASFPLVGQLAGVRRTVVEKVLLATFHPRKNLALGRAIALELTRDAHAQHVRQPLEEPAEEQLGDLLVPTTVHRDIEHVAVLISRTRRR